MQLLAHLLIAFVMDVFIQPRRAAKLREVHARCLHKGGPVERPLPGELPLDPPKRSLH